MCTTINNNYSFDLRDGYEIKINIDDPCMCLVRSLNTKNAVFLFCLKLSNPFFFGRIWSGFSHHADATIIIPDVPANEHREEYGYIAPR